MDQNHTDLERKQVETQVTVRKIAVDLEELTKQPKKFKSVSESALGAVQGQISTEVSNTLFATEQKVTQLSEKLEEQNKSIAYAPETLRDLLVRTEYLGDNMKKVNEEMDYWRNPEVLEAQEDLNRLHDPFLLVP